MSDRDKLDLVWLRHQAEMAIRNHEPYRIGPRAVLALLDEIARVKGKK